jgi:hypothetical protein
MAIAGQQVSADCGFEVDNVSVDVIRIAGDDGRESDCEKASLTGQRSDSTRRRLPFDGSGISFRGGGCCWGRSASAGRRTLASAFAHDGDTARFANVLASPNPLRIPRAPERYRGCS